MSSDSGEQIMLSGGRPVSDLKVIELRKELEIRSLPKSGNKKELIERLELFLREEQADQQSRQQGQQQQTEHSEQHSTVVQQQNESESKSPQSAAMPNVVAQYLAQQQIQLEAARRSADKARASTSSERTAMQAEIPPAAPEIPPPDENNQKMAENIGGGEQIPEEEDRTEFIPEEPTKAPTDKQKLEDDRREPETEKSDDETEGMEEGKGEDGEEQQGVSSDDGTSIENDEMENDGEEEAIEAADEVEKYDEQATEPVQDEEEAKRTEVYGEQEETEKSTTDAEFVPEEPGAPKEAKIAKELGEKTAKTHIPDGEVELDIGENEDDEEEREESADDGGSRARQISPEATIQKMKRKGEDEDGDRGTDVEDSSPAKAVESSSSAPQGMAGNEPVQVVASIAEESSKPPMEQLQETTLEGFIRRRAASPARNPPTRWIHIRNLKRPFTKVALFDLLGKFGGIDPEQFWMDSIKSNCIATYETSEQAKLARERLHNVVWPVASDMALCVEYSTDEKLKRRKAEEEREEAGNNSALGGGLGLTIVVDNRSQEVEPATGAGPKVLIQHEKDQQKLDENRKRKVEELEKSQKTLDELFKKTTTLPAIYFLPLSDAEAAKRHKSTSSTGKHHSSSSSHHHPTQSSSSSRPSNSRRSGGGRR